MNTVLVVVLHERVEFSLKVLSIPKEGVVKKLTADGSDQSLNEGMRKRCIRDGLNLINVQNPQVGVPSVRAMIVSWSGIVFLTGKLPRTSSNVVRIACKVSGRPKDSTKPLTLFVFNN
jgi:hypothetical protein